MTSRIAVLAVLGLAALSAGCASAPAHHAAAPESTLEAKRAPRVAQDDGHGVGHTILLYIPNRIFDVLDIVRARLRVGPGVGITLRATELVDLKLGAWTSVFIGLRGPRLEPSIPWPVGLDSYAGAGASFLEAESDDYQYGKGEFGIGLHVLLVGVDVGVDVLEIGDFVLGLLTIDFMEDDY
jgi:hypothetical protein